MGLTHCFFWPSAEAAQAWEVLPERATGNTPAHEGGVLLTLAQYGYLSLQVTTLPGNTMCEHVTLTGYH